MPEDWERYGYASYEAWIESLAGQSLPKTGELCAACGQPAKGYAYINDKRYCHGDDDDPTCYMRGDWPMPGLYSRSATSDEDGSLILIWPQPKPPPYTPPDDEDEAEPHE